MQAIVELFGPVYHAIYLGTIDWYPGFAYCVSAFVLIFMIAMTLYCRWFVSRWSDHKLDPETATKDAKSSLSAKNSIFGAELISSKKCSFNVV